MDVMDVVAGLVREDRLLNEVKSWPSVECESEGVNFYVIPDEHLTDVIPDSWDDVSNGEGMLWSERPVQERANVRWEQFCWDNALDGDDFEKGPDPDEMLSRKQSRNSTWNRSVELAMQYADRAYSA